MHTGIRDALIHAARNGTVVHYSTIAPLAGLDMSRADHRREMGELLCQISREAHAQGQPMLTAIVVHKSGGDLVGKGFFSLARELGRFNGGDETAFLFKEIQAVHTYWKS